MKNNNVVIFCFFEIVWGVESTIKVLKIGIGANIIRDGYFWRLILAEFEVKDLADRISFCLTLLVFLKENKELEDNKLEVAKD